MPVAEREIVEVGAVRAIGCDLVLRLASRREVADRAVSKTDAQARAWRLHRVEQRSWIVEIVPVG